MPPSGSPVQPAKEAKATACLRNCCALSAGARGPARRQLLAFGTMAIPHQPYCSMARRTPATTRWTNCATCGLEARFLCVLPVLNRERTKRRGLEVRKSLPPGFCGRAGVFYNAACVGFWVFNASRVIGQAKDGAAGTAHWFLCIAPAASRPVRRARPCL